MEMTNEKKGYEGGEDLEEKDCPLSPTDWIMFLSGEINAIKTRIYTLWAVIIAVLLALLGGSIAFINSCVPVPIHGTTLDIPTGLILLPFAVVVYLFLLKYRKRTQKEVEPLEEILEAIIDGVKDSNKIRELWKEINKVQHKDRMPE